MSETKKNEHAVLRTKQSYNVMLHKVEGREEERYVLGVVLAGQQSPAHGEHIGLKALDQLARRDRTPGQAPFHECGVGGHGRPLGE